MTTRLHAKLMKRLVASIICLIAAAGFAASPTFTIDTTQSAGKVSPILYGLMTEEINHSYDGGLYAELIQNRAFLNSPNSPVHWSAVHDDNSAATIALDSANAFNDKLTTSLRLTVTKADKKIPPAWPTMAIGEFPCCQRQLTARLSWPGRTPIFPARSRFPS